MRNRTTTAAVIGAVLLVGLVGCNPQDPVDPESASKPPAAKNSEAAGPTAKSAADHLAEATGVTTLGDPRDNTDACSNKAAGKEPHENDCSQLITTDAVSIYEFKTAKVSADWVARMKKNGDWRQVDRFALAWTARDQGLTSDGRRTELETALADLVKKNK
ncbi:hypothetical protein PUR57_26850 [Streptomyces sp. JV176]|uniref:hypothetical protein n=1 Tax=Streptomyces sp. JV176 TaxID=858630 RepID=UPI002E7A3232|nr:hypothetical protein [Streptomyces sp. JV176]MEE1802267.1 hypothetical protein [Streptomyces sp. JV176]